VRNFGVIPSPPDSRDYPIAAIIPKIPVIPTSVRLDSMILEILNQGFCGTCVGKSANGLMSAYFKKKLSSLYIYTESKKIDGIPNQEGTYPRTAMKIIKDKGSCLNETMPYTLLKSCLAFPNTPPEAHIEASKHKITAYARVVNLNEIKQALASGHMVLGVIGVGDNFMYYKNGVIGPVEGTHYGYHQVVFCGYENSINAVRGVNSWGNSWGEKGFFWLDYNVFQSWNSFVEAWIVEIELPKEKESNFYPDRIFRDLWKQQGKNINDELKKNI
jgi:C1A family cysteine protease